MGLAFVPTYINFMGIEAYGLVGFFSTLMATFSILDLGLSATMNREIARRSTLPDQAQTTRDLLRTVEIIYWGIAIVIGALVVLMSSPIASYWINPGKLSVSEVKQTVMIMGLLILLRWPFGMYHGGLLGLQKQVLTNLVNAAAATFKGLGAVFVLFWVSSTIHAFFLWQIFVSALQTSITGYLLWKHLPVAHQRPKFKMSALSEVWRFALGIMGISLVTIILTQTDKLVLVRLLPLESYGCYMLAWTVSGTLMLFSGPISSAVFPHFSQLVATSNDEEIVRLYHRSCKLISVLVFPAGSTLIFFSHKVLCIWTGNHEIADVGHFAMSLLAFGSVCNATLIIPYAVQLAYGWTSLAFWINVVSIFFLIPLLITLVSMYGMVGGAAVWAVLNLSYVFFGMQLMHRKLLIGQLRRWYIYDIGVPATVAGATAYGASLVIGNDLSHIIMLFHLVFITVLSYVFCILAVPEIRQILMALLTKVGTWINKKKVWV